MAASSCRMLAFVVVVVICLLRGHGISHGFVPVSTMVHRQMPALLRSIVAEDVEAPATMTSDTSPSPGQEENEKFQCDASVDFWRNFESKGNMGNLARIQDLLAANTIAAAANDDNRSSKSSNKRAAYWSSQLLRTSYFVATAALGTLGSDLHERFLAKDPASNVDSGRTTGTTFLNTNGGRMARNLLDSDVPTRLVLEALKSYEQDWKHVESGLLNIPWDGLAVADRDDRVRFQTDHRQLNPLFALSETERVVRESIEIFSRRNRHQGHPSGEVWLNQAVQSEKTSIRYPDYYLNDFHYQTDGWLSSYSADVYEASTETLFLGRQDAMQRQTLIPLLKHFHNNDNHDAPPSPEKILDVACGTGRFATFLRDNFPTSDVVLTDLSPFYLEKARANDDYWRKYRGVTAMQDKYPRLDDNFEESPRPASFVQANAESLPFPDESFDAVTCVYLFHELPSEARENAAIEMARVVKPGGMVVLTDSVQLGDRPPLDKAMGNFSRLNEPHYQNYRITSLAPLFEKHGLTCSEKYIASSTKTLSFIKPMERQK